MARLSFLSAVLALVLVGCADAPRATDDRRIPPEVLQFAKDWPLPGRDYMNSRATKDSRIDSSNVATLATAWEVPMPGRAAYGNFSTTPLIAGDTIYVEDLSSTISAIDRETGAVRWSRGYPGFIFGPNGVGLGWGKVFAIRRTDAVVALDARTGDELWVRSLVATTTQGIDIQPLLFDDKVFVSTVPVSGIAAYRGGDRGTLYALNQATGETVWSFDTVDSDDLWGNPEVNSGGGAWYPPAIDLGRGRIYWGIANPAPFPGTAAFPNGISRPGPNLYTNSLVNLDLKTGALDWFQQAIPHDLFDHDLALSLLVDVRQGSGTRRIVVATGKGGTVIGHDIASGAVLWTTPVGVHQNDNLTMLTGPTEVLPGTFGGVLTPPAAADGIVYVPVLNSPGVFDPSIPISIGGSLGSMPGQIVAIDAANGTILWDVQVPGDPTGGATVVNDLVLTATLQGQVFALDRATGAVVWTWNAPGGINGWPAVAGDLIAWPVGLPNPALLVGLRLPRS